MPYELIDLPEQPHKEAADLFAEIVDALEVLRAESGDTVSYKESKSKWGYYRSQRNEADNTKGNANNYRIFHYHHELHDRLGDVPVEGWTELLNLMAGIYDDIEAAMRLYVKASFTEEAADKLLEAMFSKTSGYGSTVLRTILYEDNPTDYQNQPHKDRSLITMSLGESADELVIGESEDRLELAARPENKAIVFPGEMLWRWAEFIELYEAVSQASWHGAVASQNRYSDRFTRYAMPAFFSPDYELLEGLQTITPDIAYGKDFKATLRD